MALSRIGQKKTVHVYQFIAENTVEAKVCGVQLLSGIKLAHRLSPGSRNTGQEKEADQRGANPSDGIILRALWLTRSVHAKAFSGMKNKETPRQKKEARLQGLASLFRPLSDESLLMRDTLIL